MNPSESTRSKDPRSVEFRSEKVGFRDRSDLSVALRFSRRAPRALFCCTRYQLGRRRTALRTKAAIGRGTPDLENSGPGPQRRNFLEGLAQEPFEGTAFVGASWQRNPIEVVPLPEVFGDGVRGRTQPLDPNNGRRAQIRVPGVRRVDRGMRIAYFTDTPRVGGAEPFLADIVSGVHGAGHGWWSSRPRRRFWSSWVPRRQASNLSRGAGPISACTVGDGNDLDSHAPLRIFGEPSRAPAQLSCT